jgi:hypothetical protein
MDGSQRVLQVKVLGAGLYHGQWRGPLLVEGEHCADCSTPQAVTRLNQFRDALIEVHDPVTGVTGWGNCQTWVHGHWPEFGLDMSCPAPLSPACPSSERTMPFLMLRRKCQ